MREFYTYRLQQRTNEGETLIRDRRLFQQYVANAFACIEDKKWIILEEVERSFNHKFIRESKM